MIDEEGNRWITWRGRRFKVKDNGMIQKGENYNLQKNVNNKNDTIDINELAFQSDDYGKYIEQEDKQRIEIFKNILKTKKDDDYYGFKYEDISAPIILRKEKRNNKYVMYDGQHRYIAYKQLGYKKVPYKFKD